MKRYILTTLFALVLFTGSVFAAGQVPQNDGKSEAESVSIYDKVARHVRESQTIGDAGVERAGIVARLTLGGS